MAVRMLVNGDTTSSHTPTTTEAAGGSQDAASESLLAKLQWMGITEQHFIGVDCSKVKNDEEETVLVHTAGMLWAKSLWEGKKRIAGMDVRIKATNCLVIKYGGSTLRWPESCRFRPIQSVNCRLQSRQILAHMQRSTVHYWQSNHECYNNNANSGQKVSHRCRNGTVQVDIWVQKHR